MSDDAAGWDEDGLKLRCTQWRDTLVSAGIATQAEVDAYWPGGPQNHEAPPGNWIYCYANYVRLLGRMDDAKAEADLERNEAAVQAALREEPALVELVAISPTGAPTYLSVYPKSEHALAHCGTRDFLLGCLAHAEAIAKAMPDALKSDLVPAILLEQSYQLRVLAWIVCTPGPRCPFEDHEVRPEPPTWTQELEAFDLLNIVRAHQRINGKRLQQVIDLVGRGGQTSSRPSWAMLAANAASILNVSSRALLRDHSLAAWLAQLHLTAQAKQDARDAARSVSGSGVTMGVT